MAAPKPTYTELEERIRLLEAQYNSDLDQIAGYRKTGGESRHGPKSFELLVRYSRDIILFIRRKDRRIIDFNETAIKAYGYSRDELLSLEIGDLRSPETSALVPMQVDKADLSGILFETIHRRKDGTLFPVEVSSIGADINGERCILSIIRDITERRRIEQALKESTRYLHQLINHIVDPVFVIDRQHQFVLVNDAMCTFTGWKREDLLVRSVRQLRLPTEEADKIWDQESLIFENGRNFAAEEKATDAQGIEHTVITKKSLFVDDAGNAQIVGIIADVTQLKTAEQALQKSQEILAEAQRQANIGSFEFDFQTGRLDWSDEMFRIFGIRQEDFRGRGEDFQAHIHPEDLPQVDKIREEGLTQAGPLSLDFRIVRPNGHIRFIRMISEITFDTDGNPLRRIGTFQDVTERKLAEGEQAKLIAQLQQAQKMESVGRLAGGVAHDFNNMLGVILGHAEMALEQVDPALPLYSDLMQIQKAARRSADLTRQLLAFARRQTVTPKVLDLNETITGMIGMLQRMIGENINLSWRPVEPVWPVRIDPSQIDQILANLCVNAGDAIADVGRITIETENCTLDRDYCIAHEGCVSGDYVRLAVSDNGNGMSKEIQGRIFEPFFTTKEVGKGTGLGLATVYGAVKQNSGYITVESELGTGTAITIYLPRHMENGEQTQTREPGEITRKGKETVLVAEDEIDILKLTTAMLQKLGYSVLAASSPGEAMRLAREHTCEIDLLLTDVIMPEMNGRMLAKKLQSIYPHVKCLFMSGYTADVVARHGVLDEGINFIQKPFSAQDLANKLVEVLGRE